MKTPDMKAPSRTTALRHLHGAGRHLGSNVVAYLALAVAVGSGGSYALAATQAMARSPSAPTQAAAYCTSPNTRAAGVIRPVSGSARCSTATRERLGGGRCLTETSRAVRGLRSRIQVLAYTRSPSQLRTAVTRPTTHRWSASTTVNRRIARHRAFSDRVDADGQHRC